MPMASAIQGTLGNADHAYMNMPIGKSTPATQAPYNRASGPRVGKFFLYNIDTVWGSVRVRDKDDLLIQALLIEIT